MRVNRLLCLLWIVVATTYALRGLVMVATGQDVSSNMVQMFTALVLMKLYEMDDEDK